ncbi:MAG: 4Fe-4S binding protein [Coriobacteriia bacterium]
MATALTTRDGREWLPYIESIAMDACIGCGSCARACPRKAQTHTQAGS